MSIEKGFPHYPAIEGAVPMGLDADRITRTVEQMKAQQPPSPVIDRDTADTMREALSQLISRRDHHEALRARYASDLAEVEEQLAAKDKALAVLQEAVATKPALRHDIAEVRFAIESLKDRAADLRKDIARHTAIRDAATKQIEAFDHAKLKRLEAEEKVLSQAGV